jgi:UDP-N-acetylglucosamine 2-epimerase (non-hydrolysing)
MMAKCTVSDSGTISEESSILSFPAVTLRRSMERPEAIDSGTIILTGFDRETVLSSIDLVIREHEGGTYRHIPDEYRVENTSMRVLKLIMGTARLSNSWHGILPNV